MNSPNYTINCKCRQLNKFRLATMLLCPLQARRNDGTSIVYVVLQMCKSSYKRYFRHGEEVQSIVAGRADSVDQQQLLASVALTQQLLPR